MGRGWNPQKPRTHMTTLIYVEHHQPYELIIIFELFFFIQFVRFPRSAPDLGGLGGGLFQIRLMGPPESSMAAILGALGNPGLSTESQQFMK